MNGAPIDWASPGGTAYYGGDLLSPSIGSRDRAAISTHNWHDTCPMNPDEAHGLGSLIRIGTTSDDEHPTASGIWDSACRDSIHRPLGRSGGSSYPWPERWSPRTQTALVRLSDDALRQFYKSSEASSRYGSCSTHRARFASTTTLSVLTTGYYALIWSRETSALRR